MALGPHGPVVVTTLEHAREVLTQPDRFDFPVDVSRRAMRHSSAPAGPSARSAHAITPPLEAEAVDRGMAVFAVELATAADGLTHDSTLDAMSFLRSPVARSTTAAVLAETAESARDRVAGLVLTWVDALGPIIASRSSPHRWSRIRRVEDRARDELHSALADEGCRAPAAVATLLAAGVQVPIAAGAWLLVKLAEDHTMAAEVRARPELARAVAWETVRLCPPTWITARITAREVRLGATTLPEGTVVMVSPLLLGRLEALTPGREAGQAPLDVFAPLRWDQDRIRPGAWLPFGAGPHACPGRNLGLAQLTHLADWAREWSMLAVEPVQIDQTRGIFPSPAILRITTPGTPSCGNLDPVPSQQDGPA